VVVSILAKPELTNYYHNKAMLAEIQKQNEKIRSLTQQYDAQIQYIEAEPNVLGRLRPMMFGQKPHAKDTAFPQVRNETLRAETGKILARIEQPQESRVIPVWLDRIRTPRIRRGLFLAGAGLVIIACIFFGTNKRPERPGSLEFTL
jgi:hypothetical protein